MVFRPEAGVVLDTSALAAVLFAEPGRDPFIAVLAAAEDPLISAATLAEASMAMLAGTGEGGIADLDAYALAKATDRPLLFKGTDFTHTDIRPALPA